MALAIFTKGILEDQPITVFNHGKMVRDFTYVDDIVSGVVASLDKNYPFEIFNLGCGETIELLAFIEEIEKATGKKAQMNMMPIQAGDVLKSYADIEKSREMLGYEPQTMVKEGIPKFVSWYRKYYNI
jgi:UDP-glucuronate 4-epimerase